MGDVADDMVIGLSCSECGIYFEREHGHPVLCDECHEPGSAFAEATEPEVQWGRPMPLEE